MIEDLTLDTICFVSEGLELTVSVDGAGIMRAPSGLSGSHRLHAVVPTLGVLQADSEV